MKRLILMRHAKTEPWAEGIDDHARALLQRGHEDAKLITDEIVAKGWKPDFVAVSSARRAKETWRNATALHSVPNEIYEELYLASASELSDFVETKLLEYDSVMIIGHNPGIHEFACDVARTGKTSPYWNVLAAMYPTGTASLYEGDPLTLAGLIHARVLRGEPL